MSDTMTEIRPMVLNRFATLFWHEGDWERESKQSAFAFSPIGIDAGPRAKLSVYGSRVSVHDESGNVHLGTEHIHDLMHAYDTLLYLGNRHDGAWYEVASGQLVYRDPPGRWFMRWLCYKNTRLSRAMNAMMIALHADQGAKLPSLDELASTMIATGAPWTAA